MECTVREIDYSILSLRELNKEKERVKAEFVARMVACKLNMDRKEKGMYVKLLLELDNLIEKRELI